MINPAFIEGTLRSIAAIPLFGAGVERVYAAMNEKLKNENGGLYLTYMVLSRMLYTKYGYATGGDEKSYLQRRGFQVRELEVVDVNTERITVLAY